MDFVCKKCKKAIPVEGEVSPGYPKKIHSGFASQGYLYCDGCSTVLVFNAYDKKYVSLIGEKNPWMLTRNEQKIFEDNLVKCPCGGNFTFDAKPRCPYCNTEIPGINPLQGTETRSIYYVILGDLIDGDKTNIWKNNPAAQKESV